ncbi:plasmid mobilization relaxosome protein MobC [Streptomyces sp. NPDC051569]|uniref:plasmid mobilization relaxosome protein MobC n=1 Tax=Streptomyces sp. NPDC051569 TaxID=3365661 RepID=UPI0037879426
MKPTSDTGTDAEESPEPATKARKLGGLWRRAFNNTAPGGASCTQSPTVGRSLGSSTPGVAEEARREGAPGPEAGAAGGPAPDELDAVQRAVLATAHADERPHTMPTSTPGPAAKAARLDSDGEVRERVAVFVHDKIPALDVPPLTVHASAQTMPKGKIRRFNGKRRTLRVGPVGFTEAEHADLLDAAGRHGYEGTLSGYLADIALAFIRGAFSVDLPLHTGKQEVQEFRAKIRWEINRIGVNINQMVYVLHRDNRIEPDIRERLEHLDRLLTHIARALLIPAEPTDGGSL